MMGYRRKNATQQAKLVCVAILICGVTGEAQATPFKNLDFEWAVVGTPVEGELPASEALPYWANDNWDAGKVVYDDVSLGAVMVSVHDAKSRFMKPLGGAYSVLLQDSTSKSRIAWISQTGDIPDWAESITFVGEAVCGAPVLSLNGTVIPTWPLWVDPAVNASHGSLVTYTGDISAFAGNGNVELRFTSTGWNTLDDIEFAPDVVPEPSTLTLLAVGAFTAFARLLRRRLKLR
jgi:hypothetical protein